MMPAARANPLFLVQGAQALGKLGSTATNPASSCAAIYLAGASTGSGLYWLTTGSIAYNAYCDMTPGDGGWTLVARAVNTNLNYSNALWTDTNLSNATVYDFTLAGFSKYQAFLHVPFTQLRSSDTTSWSTSNFTATVASQASTRAMFAGGGINLGDTTSAYWNDRAPADQREWNCTAYRNIGINQYAYLGGGALPGGGYCDWNGGARFGQRVNAYHSGTGDHVGQGWGCYSTISGGVDATLDAITQLLWVK
jgi:hypothetical protein